MDSFQRSARNFLRAFALSRESERRRDPDWIASQFRHARLVEIHGDAVPVSDATGELLVSELGDAPIDSDELIFLGHDGERAWFARDVGDAAHLPEQASLWDFRRAGLHLDPGSAGLLAYAKALCHWRRHNRYCGRCGATTRIVDGGHRSQCDACGLEQFPRLDPAIIVCITQGDAVLLGRQPHWPDKRFSVLAGFVEHGESLEDAVCREVMEEAGLRLASVHYHSSQPWPFPASLMLGFTAESVDREISRGEELEHVRWVERGELAGLVRQGQLRLPYRLSIAYRLLADWYARDGGSLEEVIERAPE